MDRSKTVILVMVDRTKKSGTLLFTLKGLDLGKYEGIMSRKQDALRVGTTEFATAIKIMFDSGAKSVEVVKSGVSGKIRVVGINHYRAHTEQLVFGAFGIAYPHLQFVCA